MQPPLKKIFVLVIFSEDELDNTSASVEVPRITFTSVGNSDDHKVEFILYFITAYYISWFLPQSSGRHDNRQKHKEATRRGYTII